MDRREFSGLGWQGVSEGVRIPSFFLLPGTLLLLGAALGSGILCAAGGQSEDSRPQWAQLCDILYKVISPLLLWVSKPQLSQMRATAEELLQRESNPRERCGWGREGLAFFLAWNSWEFNAIPTLSHRIHTYRFATKSSSFPLIKYTPWDSSQMSSVSLWSSLTLNCSNQLCCHFLGFRVSYYDIFSRL